MKPLRRKLPPFSAALVMTLSAALLQAQGTGLPATAPTQTTPGTMAPIAATATAADLPGSGSHPGKVSCESGQLTIHAENSSLNQILRAIARCTGMRISGGVAEQRVFGNYGPAAATTVLATLLDGTGSNMLLRETAADQPAELILSPRTGGVTPPSPSSYAEENSNADMQPPPQAQPAQNPYQRPPMMRQAGVPRGAPGMAPNDQTQVPQPDNGSAVTSPPAIPIGPNNVNGSPNNVSPTAASYPTTNSVPLDSVATPSTTPSTSGIVDAPNPPAAGSDTAAALNGATRNNPGTTNISPDNTSNTSSPGATNTTVPANSQSTPSTDLTPEQIFQQLQQRQQQQQQQQQDPQNSPQ